MLHISTVLLGLLQLLIFLSLLLILISILIGRFYRIYTVVITFRFYWNLLTLSHSPGPHAVFYTRQIGLDSQPLALLSVRWLTFLLLLRLLIFFYRFFNIQYRFKQPLGRQVALLSVPFFGGTQYALKLCKRNGRLSLVSGFIVGTRSAWKLFGAAELGPAAF
ncbi:hypothetical protein E2C01_068565 [Portunus trituberculatus]|uniref:Uncharacterized protein n=1 Tax=Portunus trituberculatus TaxID=210409 RepID=A0A5B7HW84_PORTR|nr:hypothetical protein [Portunus trituberculatus]